LLPVGLALGWLLGVVEGALADSEADAFGSEVGVADGVPVAELEAGWIDWSAAGSVLRGQRDGGSAAQVKAELGGPVLAHGHQRAQPGK